MGEREYLEHKNKGLMHRLVAFVLNIQTVYQIPVLAEHFLSDWAKVEFHPAIDFDDLKKAISEVNRSKLGT